MFAAFFAVAALVALAGLCAIALNDVPRISGTVALILTAAAFVAALFH
ncbi:hypothetical protein YW5DRAFT_01913 [Streptomyces sp. Ncost-T6T-1]|nr:hypothetical protein [Streptomyces sp. Ncost-T6T-1]SBV00585.1 hypothetical protein YW5DRAFT_01913 [Streptomyces sp. Ncost-T6T-1]